MPSRIPGLYFAKRGRWDTEPCFVGKVEFYEVYYQLRTGAHRDAEEIAIDRGIEVTLSAQTKESALIDHMLVTATRVEFIMHDRYDDEA